MGRGRRGRIRCRRAGAARVARTPGGAGRTRALEHRVLKGVVDGQGRRVLDPAQRALVYVENRGLLQKVGELNVPAKRNDRNVNLTRGQRHGRITGRLRQEGRRRRNSAEGVERYLLPVTLGDGIDFPARLGDLVVPNLVV